MIVGIGHDLVDMRQLQQVYSRQPRLPQRLLTKEEQEEFATRKNSINYLGGRFAAKEALAKALRIGMRTPLGWQKVWILDDEAGAPVFYYAPSLQNYLQQHGIAICHLSITHHGDYASAVAIAEAR
ncbi:MAG: holo-ACP synthase [Gammaproteobacteria bacterium WSBS_2016_MAG_OTU1]